MEDLNLVIIDDEPNNRALIQKYIEFLYPLNTHVFHLCDSVQSAVQILEKHGADIVFLDIEMPGENGFELFKQIDTSDFEVVFVTAYAEHMSYSVNELGCFGYITKPIERDNLKSIFNRYQDKYEKDNCFRLISHTNNKRELIHLDEIIYCKGEGSYCAIVTSKEKYIQSKTLKDIKKRLPEDRFLRVHKSFIVNLNHVKNYSKEQKQIELKVPCFESLENLPVSKTYKDTLEKLIL